MEQYISKSALVAEIEKLKDEAKIYPSDFFCGRLSICEELMNFLDTCEVKEVDLEKELDDAKDLAMRDMAWKVHVMISEGKSISEVDHYVCGICDF